MKTLGIIGGLGPETTSEFYLDIIFSCQKKNKVSRPDIIIASVPMPYPIEKDLIMENKNVGRYIPFLIKEAKRLENAGADLIVMPCNSLHIFIKEIRSSVNVPVLSIVEETVKFLKKNNISRAGIISTSATIENRLYETAFEEAGISYETPDRLQQAKMGKIILNLVNGQKNNRDRDELIGIINDLGKKDVDCIALACTDLQLLIPKHPTLKIFDTMKLFARATVEEMLE